MKPATGKDEPSGGRPGPATAGEFRRLFTEYRAALNWLAEFLTGDENMAAACLIDACALAETQNEVLQEWLLHWARRATIRSAIEMQHARIAQLAAAYERHPCTHPQHAALSQESTELLVAQSNVLRDRLDVLCRFVLVMRGLERYSFPDIALLLGFSRPAVETVYCAALELLEAIRCETRSARDLSGATHN